MLATHPRPTGLPDFNPSPSRGRPRVGLTTANFGYGGIEFFDRLLMDAIAAQGWDVSGVVAATWKYADPRVTGWFGSRLPIGAGRDDLHALARASDVVVVSGVLDAEQWMGCGRPCATVLVAHGSCPWTRKVMRWGHRADACVAVSKVAAATFPADSGRVRVIHNIPHAQAPTIPRHAIREEWGVRDDQIVIGYLGRWAEEKRPDLPLSALAYLPERYVYVMVGPYQEGITRTMRKGAGGRLITVGPTDDAGSALRGFDMLCLPSIHEGFGMVAAEAWAAGVPLISTPVGIVAERPDLARVVSHDATPADWAAAIEGLEFDPDLFPRIRRARDFARRHLTPDRFAREWAAVLGPLVAR